jgi:hypothetical protein
MHMEATIRITSTGHVDLQNVGIARDLVAQDLVEVEVEVETIKENVSRVLGARILKAESREELMT